MLELQHWDRRVRTSKRFLPHSYPSKSLEHVAGATWFNAYPRTEMLTPKLWTVRGQTDIREIYNDTLPLWFDHLNPSKINFGLAAYGRGYTLDTLAGATCNQLDCPFVGPSLPGPCTNFNGVLSLAEIK